MPPLLAINIPTYERLASFSEILLSLEAEINDIGIFAKDLVQINVFENDSSDALDKFTLCRKIKERSALDLNFFKNNSNIGADLNILQACTANKEAKFTWVLGDDDHLIHGCLKKIMDVLLDDSINLGLLILRDLTYKVHPALMTSAITSYLHLAYFALQNQPHFLIAHTLISVNIFKTSEFDEQEAKYVIDRLNPRIGLRANFSHMRGMINGLLHSNGEHAVIVSNFVSLDTGRRLKGEIDLSSEIIRIYYFYYLWLLSELGVRPEQILNDGSIDWLFSPY